MTDKKQCSAKVPWGNWGVLAGHVASCKRSAKAERDGKWYCTIHDPAYRERKEAERSKAWKQQWALDTAGNIAKFACREINPDNPRAVAEAIVPMWEALKDLLAKYQQGETDTGVNLSQNWTNARNALAKANEVRHD